MLTQPYGFGDNKTPMQQGKIKACLLAEVVCNDKLDTRKNHVLRSLKNGGTPFAKEMRSWNAEKARLVYGIYNDITKTTFRKVTKTEYEFALYLLDSNILNLENNINTTAATLEPPTMPRKPLENNPYSKCLHLAKHAKNNRIRKKNQSRLSRILEIGMLFLNSLVEQPSQRVSC